MFVGFGGCSPDALTLPDHSLDISVVIAVTLVPGMSPCSTPGLAIQSLIGVPVTPARTYAVRFCTPSFAPMITNHISPRRRDIYHYHGMIYIACHRKPFPK